MKVNVQANRFRCRHPKCSGNSETFSLFTAQEHIALHFCNDCSDKSLKNLHYAFQCRDCSAGFITKFYAVNHFMAKRHRIAEIYSEYSLINRIHTERYLKFSNVYMAAFLEAVPMSQMIEMDNGPYPVTSTPEYSHRTEIDRPPRAPSAFGNDRYVADPYANDTYGSDPYGNTSFGDNSDNCRPGARNTRSPVRSPAYTTSSVTTHDYNPNPYQPMRERQNNVMEQNTTSDFSNSFSDHGGNKRNRTPDKWDKKNSSGSQRGRGGPGGGRGNRRGGDPRRGQAKSFGKRTNSDSNTSFYGDSSFTASYSAAPQRSFNSSKVEERRSFSRSRSRSPSWKPNVSSYGNDNSNNSRGGHARSPPGNRDKRSFSRSVSRSPSRSPLNKAPAAQPSTSTFSGGNNHSGGYDGYKTSYKNSSGQRGGFGKRRSRSPPRKKSTPPGYGQFQASPPRRSRSRSFSKSPER